MKYLKDQHTENVNIFWNYAVIVNLETKDVGLYIQMELKCNLITLYVENIWSSSQTIRTKNETPYKYCKDLQKYELAHANVGLTIINLRIPMKVKIVKT